MMIYDDSILPNQITFVLTADDTVHKYKPCLENMDTRKFTLHVINSPEGGFTGRCMELPAAIGEGDTMEELKTNMT